MNYSEAQRLAAMAHKQKQGGDVMGALTLRDYFAAKAMQAMCNQPERMAKTLRDLKATEEQAAEYIAMGAYHLADAMLKARQQ